MDKQESRFMDHRWCAQVTPSGRWHVEKSGGGRWGCGSAERLQEASVPKLGDALGGVDDAKADR